MVCLVHHTWRHPMSQEWFIVDGHSHFIPREAISLIMSSPMGKRMMGFGLGGSASAGPMSKTLDIEGKLKVMEEAGVDMAVIHMAALKMVGLEVFAAMKNGNAPVAR